jgi:signal transduction histidine kinase/CheY-like chemotaxis protein
MSDKTRAELIKEVARLEKVNRVLIRRVQRSINSAGSDFGLFEQNIHLDRLVKERTRELESRNVELSAARNKAEEAVISKSRFLANMSHELRTPLNAVIGVAQILESTALSEEQSGYLELLSQASQHLLGLIDDILDFTRVESGVLPLQLAPICPRKLVNEVISSLKHMPDASGLEVTAQISPSVPDGIQADARRLRQVLVNLIGNACKFTDVGSVSVWMERRGELLHVSVKDTGIGIHSDQLAHIFDRFAQADSGSSRRHGGTGLGLAISRHLVRLWGGELTLQSTPGEGSMLSFTMPCLPAEVPSKPRPLAKPTDRQEVKVLLVDDHPVNRLVARRLLEILGVEVIEAASGEAALELLHASDFDVILMDCQMPGMDGFETTRRIRKMREGKSETPIIALTASVLEEDRKKCLEAGMNSHLAKPVQRETLDEVLSLWRSSTAAVVSA